MATYIPPVSEKYPRGKHPNSQKNLKPFPKGSNGGSHPGYSLAKRLKDTLDKPLKQPKEDAPVGEKIVYSTLEGALLREPTPFKEVWDRVEGKVENTPPAFNDNRVINFNVYGEKAEELISGVRKRLGNGSGD